MKLKTWEMALVAALFLSDDLRVSLFSSLGSMDVGSLLVLFAVLVYTQRKHLGVLGGSGGHSAHAAAAAPQH